MRADGLRKADKERGGGRDKEGVEKPRENPSFEEKEIYRQSKWEGRGYRLRPGRKG